jgi:hypothetical protein
MQKIDLDYNGPFSFLYKSTSFLQKLSCPAFDPATSQQFHLPTPDAHPILDHSARTHYQN